MNTLFWGFFNPLFLSLQVQVLSTSTIQSDPPYFSGWPTVAIDPQGTLYVGYSGGRKRHVDPFGKNYLIKSVDQGKTWSPPQLIRNSSLDDRDAGLLVLRDGSLLYSTFNSNYFKTHLNLMIEHYGPQIQKEWATELKLDETPFSSVLISHDQGQTFSDPYPVPVSTPHGPINNLDGTLSYLGNRSDDGFIELYHSIDGTSWSLKSRLFPSKIYPPYTLCEPHLIQIDEHNYVAFFRTNHPKKSARYLFQSWSQDGGATWTAPAKTPLYGNPPHLTRLSNGEILLTYANRYWPYTIQAALSVDGKVWRRLGSISVGSGEDFGYPSTVELPDNSLFTVFYDNGVLRAVRWKIARG